MGTVYIFETGVSDPKLIKKNRTAVCGCSCWLIRSSYSYWLNDKLIFMKYICHSLYILWLVRLSRSYKIRHFVHGLSAIQSILDKKYLSDCGRLLYHLLYILYSFNSRYPSLPSKNSWIRATENVETSNGTCKDITTPLVV